MTLINLFFHCKHPEELYTIANTSMVQLSEWVTVDKLHLNLDKTCYSIFGSSQLSISDFKLYLNGREVKWLNIVNILV